MTARTIDTNGWVEIKGNPITRVGVFPYSGESLKLERGRVYNVYRPAEELQREETVNSFKLIPWTNDHPSALLGDPENGRIPAEDYGISGVTGEDVYFDNDFLLANIKILTKELADEVASGKKELSAAYTFDCIMQKGMYNGIEYEVVQRNIRGNHLSLVDQGRAGPEVSVLDSSEGGEMEPNKTEEKEVMADAAGEELGQIAMLQTKVQELSDKLDRLMGRKSDEAPMEAEANDDEAPVNPNAENAEKKEASDEDKEGDKKDEKKDSSAMDAVMMKKLVKEFSDKEKLADNLSHFVGVFDSREMTLSEVSQYGVSKLGLKCQKGHEQTALDAYFKGKKDSFKPTSSAMDHKSTSTKGDPLVEAYIRGEL